MRSMNTEGVNAATVVNVPSAHPSRVNAATAAAQDRRRQFVMTSVLAGMTYREIHAAMRRLSPPMHASLATISKDVHWCREHWREVSTRSYEQVVEHETAKLDALERAVGRKALAGDLKAVDRMLQIARRRERLLGLNALQRAQTDLDERRVRIEEAQVTILMTLLDGILGDLGHDAHDPTVAGIVAARLRAIEV